MIIQPKNVMTGERFVQADPHTWFYTTENGVFELKQRHNNQTVNMVSINQPFSTFISAVRWEFRNNYPKKRSFVVSIRQLIDHNIEWDVWLVNTEAAEAALHFYRAKLCGWDLDFAQKKKTFQHADEWMAQHKLWFWDYNNYDRARQVIDVWLRKQQTPQLETTSIEYCELTTSEWQQWRDHNTEPERRANPDTEPDYKPCLRQHPYRLQSNLITQETQRLLNKPNNKRG